MLCKNCHKETGDEVLVDLGSQPLANSLVLHATDVLGTDQDGFRLEHRYPLAPVICANWHCRLIQLPPLPDDVEPFTADYPYRSGQSETWKEHLSELCAKVLPVGHVVEVGGNDGTLNHFLPPTATGYLNIDPTAPANGQRFLRCFMRPGLGVANQADCVFALNVAAHVPDLDIFFAGIREVMKDNAKLVVEVQDVNKLIERGEWDCIYHEHYSYFNGSTLADAIERRGFFVSKIEPIGVHGGSVRVYAYKNLLVDHPLSHTPLRIIKPYPQWPRDVEQDIRATAVWFSLQSGRRVVGYGAPAKANTMLNACGITTRQMEYIVDSTPEKIGKFTPASHIEIKSPDVLDTDTPDIIVVLAWNWLSEIRPKLQAHVDRGVEIWCRGERVA